MSGPPPSKVTLALRLRRWLRSWRGLARDGWQLGELSARIEDGPGQAGGWGKLLYLGLILRHLRPFRRLMIELRDPARPDRVAMAQANPRSLFKILHPYQHAGLSVDQRVQALLDHHDLAGPLMGPALYHQAYGPREGARVCDIALPNGHGLLPVRLTRFPRYCREGELSLALYDPFGTLLYALTFSLEPLPGGGAGLLIGSLIGSAPKEVVKHLTKLMLGLRPQNLMVLMLQDLAQHWGLNRLRAVGRQSHVFAGTERESRLQFDYDAFWLELGGQASSVEGCAGPLFELPLQASRRGEDEVPPQKRAQYRRRYAFQDEVAARLVAGLHDWKQRSEAAEP